MNEAPQFPDPIELARERGEAFQRLSPEARIHEIAAMMALGWKMIKASPHRELIEQRMNEQENEWQRIQNELFARHGA